MSGSVGAALQTETFVVQSRSTKAASSRGTSGTWEFEEKEPATAHPVTDEAGEITEVVGTVMDISEQWEARTRLEKAFGEIRDLEDRLHHENLALRDQIDQAFMFEEILGSSPALDARGQFLQHLEHGNWLNAPCGLALAPLDFGRFSHHLPKPFPAV